EDARLIATLGYGKARFERGKHLLHALCSAILLLHPILQAIDFFLELVVRLLELGSIPKQGNDALVLLLRGVRTTRKPKESELTQCFHEGRGGRPPHTTRSRRPASQAGTGGRAPGNTPATCLTSCCGPSADPAHAPRGCAAPGARAESAPAWR